MDFLFLVRLVYKWIYMVYNKLLITGLVLLYSYGMQAQVQEKVKIEEATVFLRGAELTSNAKVNLPAGESEIIFTNIAGELDENSINVAADKSVSILSTTFRKDYLAPERLTPRIKELKDSIEKVKDQQSAVMNKQGVVEQQLAIIRSNTNVAGANTGLSVTELQKLMDLVNVKMENLLNEQTKLVKQSTKLNEQLATLNAQLVTEQQKGQKPGGQLVVKFYTPNAATSNVVITYVTQRALWKPVYDLRVSQLDKPINLLYKANIYQSTGVRWDDVKLTLSTGNPAEGGQAPLLTPLNLYFYVPPQPAAAMRAYKVPLVNSESVEKEMSTDAGIADVASAPVYQALPGSVDNAGINTSFTIDIPYSVPSDGQGHQVTVKTYDMPATYRYYAVPKLDKDVFLQAQATNWQEFNLLPGQANIFYDGTFVGESYIDTRNVSDTLTLSLGRDKKVVIRREQDKKLHSVKMIGSNQRESFTYTISIRNTRKQPIDLVVADQLPVSNEKDIVIEDVDTNGGTLTESTGEVKWNLHLNANETKELKLGYTVKYPKGKTVVGLR